MINNELINPKSIVIVGGSNDISKIGGKILHNILKGNFQGNLHVINPREKEVQGINSVATPQDLPNVEMAIIALPAKFVKGYIETLAVQNNVKAFIVFSAGFSEMG
ncbi:MAG: CoA-binding protein, partial [Bacteriovoracaceae bacterium]|nr:CoA-binding protein [Bacteriovoracaceae bacterium]